MRKHLILWLLLFSGLFTVAQPSNMLVTFGKFKVEYGDLQNTSITIYQDGKQIDKTSPDKSGKFEFRIELNHQYQFYFSKPHYVTKIVNFDASVPNDVLSSPDFIPFPDFDFYVTLFESYPEVDTMYFKNPVGKIKYSRTKNDFDWDKDYTLQIVRHMEEIEAEIRKKREDKILEDEKRKQEAEQKAIADQEAKKEAERLAQQKALAEQQAKKEAERQSELAKKQQDKEAKDIDKQQQDAQRLADKQAQEQQKQAEQQEREALKNKPEPTPEKQPVTNLNEKTVENNKPASEPETIKEKPVVNTYKQPENKVVVVEKENETDLTKVEKKPEYQSSSKTNVAPSVFKTQAPMVNDVTKMDVKGKKIFRTEIIEDDHTYIYLKIEYDWGGPFYFIQDETNAFRNISKSFYLLKTQGKPFTN